jgi:hypothetical protein
MTELFKWVLDNKDTVIQLLTGAVTVASLIATLTPNNSDNAWVARVNKVVSWVALNIGKAKSTPEK